MLMPVKMKFQIFYDSASSDCTWPTDDLVCISEDLELEGRPSAICWWETLDNKKIAIIGNCKYNDLSLLICLVNVNAQTGLLAGLF